MIIDVHNHIGLSPDGGHGKIEELLEVMDTFNVEKSVLFATDEEGWQPTYKRLNNKIVDVQLKYPDRIIAFARIVPSQEEAVDEFKRCLDLGVKGLKLKGNDGFHPDQACELFDLIKDKEHFPVLMHTDHELVENKPTTWEEFIKEYPNIDFIMAHCGKADYKKCAEVLNKYPNAYCDTSTSSLNRTRWVYDEAGADKILFASDYPYSHVAVELKKFEILVKDKADMEKICYSNAKKVLGL